jgi:hypothetical protein
VWGAGNIEGSLISGGGEIPKQTRRKKEGNKNKGRKKLLLKNQTNPPLGQIAPKFLLSLG